jgi:ribosomal protein L30E
MALVISILSLITMISAGFVIYKLNLYIKSLEDKVGKQIILVENLTQSLKEVIAEGYLQNDGRLKKFSYQKENRKIIFNGRSEEETIEL